VTPKEKNSNLTAEWLRANMHYDPQTGGFHWTKPGFGRTVGKPIGSKMWTQGNTYLTMKVDGVVYYAHRLAWLYVHGRWPEGSIDHIDCNRTNNAIANLREATPAQNAARRDTSKRMIAPSRGVFPQDPGYVARLHYRLHYEGKRHYLGYFPTVEEARRAAYEAAAQKIHGEFAHKSEESPPRGDYMNASSCEICGSESNLRLDCTVLGNPRGKLCVNCWGFIRWHGMNPKQIWAQARNAVRYIESLDVPEDVIPPMPRETTRPDLGEHTDG
jgi:hypothetical protein